MNETLEEIRKELHEMNKTLKTISGCQERNVENVLNKNIYKNN